MSTNDNPSTPFGAPDGGRNAATPGQRPSPGATTPPPPPPLTEPTFQETIEARRPVPADLTGSGSSESSGKADAAKDEARQVGHEGADSAKRVAGSAKDEAADLAHEAGDKARDLFGELTTDLREQAGAQQQKVAEGLRSLGEELRSMADSGENGGTATSLVGQAAHRAGSAADWLDNRDPGSLLDEVKGFARRRPGAFLAVAAGAGLLAGRMTRGLVGAHQDEQEDGPAQQRSRQPQAGQDPAANRGVPTAPQPVPNRVGEPIIDTAGPTIGSGGVGGTGSNPGVASPGATGPRPGGR
ncbi:hypothetical protein JTF08_09845 [Micrococcaceae bacterium RIT802]|nr:hypothetical protein [Micrococcaceae bacterium RIT 802]